MPKSRDEINDLPDDFFNDLADENFIDEVVDKDEEDDPQLKRCMNEIKVLEREIEKKRQNIKERQDDLTVEEKLRRTFETLDRQARATRSRSGSLSRSRRHRDRARRRRSRSRSPRRSRSPHVSRRHDERSRERRHIDRPISPLRGRRRSISPHQPKRSTSVHRNISFLEELAQKFAEKGQAFPEKDALLMGHNSMNNSGAIEQNAPIPMDFGNPLPYDPSVVQPPIISIPNYSQVGFPQSQGMYYGMNPMSIMAGNAPPPTAGNLAPFADLNRPEMSTLGANLPLQIQAPSQSGFSENQRASIINRCEHAIKLIRAKDNRVPVMKFQFNRTSLVVSNAKELLIDSVNKSPLQAHSPLNISFKLNAAPNVPLKPVNGLKVLPKRVKDIAQSLGIKSAFLFDKMRTKELNAQIADQLKTEHIVEQTVSNNEILIQTNTVPMPMIETTEATTQTTAFKCEQCAERNKRVMISAHTQIFLKNISIGVQTNEKDYREPIVELLSKLTAAQLVAIKDFANIVGEPYPRSEIEMRRTRERLMDIYSLSQRDADSVRAAEEIRIDDGYIEPRRYRNGEPFGEGPSRDFDRSSSPLRFNGTPMERSNFGGNFERNSFNSSDHSMDDRPRMMMDDPFRVDDFRRHRQQEDEREELERKRYIEMERRRELELELNQRRYDEQRMETERLRIEQERRQLAMPNLPQPPNQLPFEDERRGFNREMDDRDGSQTMFNTARGVMNRRGRGTFRDNFRGRGSRR